MHTRKSLTSIQVIKWQTQRNYSRLAGDRYQPLAVIPRNNRSKVPATMPTNPIALFLESFSLKIRYANSTETTMLSLSMGTIMLAGPIRNALKSMS